MPVAPWQVYEGEGYVDFQDFFGTEYTHANKRTYMPFKEARQIVRKLNLKNQKDWFEYTKSGKLSSDITRNPQQVYTEWLNLGDWLGTGVIASKKRKFVNFPKARTFARSLKLRTIADWQSFSKTDKRPDHIPANHRSVYLNSGWIDWTDFLGKPESSSQPRKNWLSFSEARQFVRSKEIASSTEWRKWAKTKEKPSNIPANPDTVYKDKGWKGWPDFLVK